MAKVQVCSGSTAIGVQDGGALITIGSTVYLIGTSINGSLNLYVYKSTNGGDNWSNVSTQSANTITGEGGSNFLLMFTSGALDSAGYIHVIVTDNYNTLGRIFYAKYNTSNDTWSSWENVVNKTVSTLHSKRVVLVDSNDKPHILYVGKTTYYEVWYTNKVGASWSTPELVHTTENSADGASISALIAGDTIAVSWGNTNDYASTNVVPGHRIRTNGEWGTPVTWTNGTGGIIGKNTIVYFGGQFCIYIPGEGDSVPIYENDVSIITGISNILEAQYTANGDENCKIVCYQDNSNSYAYYKINTGSGWSSAILIDNVTNTVWRCISDYTYNNDSRPEATVAIAWGDYNDGYTYFYKFTSIYGSKGNKPAYIEGFSNPILPDGDVSTGLWKNESGGSTLYPSLADSNDSTYAWYNNANIGDYFEVTLPTPSGPSGVHQLYWKGFRKDGTQSTDLMCALRQGSSTIIASGIGHITTSGIVTFIQDLTPAEVSNITDYGDLRLRITIVGVT